MSVEEKRITRFHRLVREKTGGGADQSSEGTSGTLTAHSIETVLKGLVEGKRVVDLGSGAGHAIGASLILGASSAYGIELPANEHLFIVTKALQECPKVNALIPGFADNSRFYPDDLEDIMARGGCLRGGPQVVFSFWDGMSEDARDAICHLVAYCSTCETFIVTNARNDTIEHVLWRLGEGWVSKEPVKVNMSGSGETKRAWTFTRDRAVVASDDPPFHYLDSQYETKLKRVEGDSSVRRTRRRTT